MRSPIIASCPLLGECPKQIHQECLSAAVGSFKSILQLLQKTHFSVVSLCFDLLGGETDAFFKSKRIQVQIKPVSFSIVNKLIRLFLYLSIHPLRCYQGLIWVLHDKIPALAFFLVATLFFNQKRFTFSSNKHYF